MTSEEKLHAIYLKTGELYFSEKPAVVTTVLGSCLSVTMFHRPSGISSISHGLLPECRDRTCIGDCPKAAKYVACSIKEMIKRFNQCGIRRGDIEVKVFGGADMFDAARNRRVGFSVGKFNIVTAMNILEREGLRIVSIDVGGTKGRKLFFHTRTGEVLITRLQPNVILAKRTS